MVQMLRRWSSAAAETDVPLRVLLLSTPSPFEVPIARGILDGGARLVAVVERTDHPLTRTQIWRRRLTRAARNRWPGRWPPNLARLLRFTRDAHDASFIELIRTLAVDLMVVSRWGILRPEVFGQPRLGTLNAHLSLLPELRGADPVPGALLAGLRRTGITVHCIDAGIDTGQVILQRRFPILPQDTEVSVCARAARLMRPMWAHVIQCFRAGCVPRRPQDPAGAYHFGWRKHFGVEQDDVLPIDWQAPAWLIERVTRLSTCCVGRQGWHATVARGRAVQVNSAVPVRPGAIVAARNGRMVVAAGEAFVELLLDRGRAHASCPPVSSCGAPSAGDTLESATWPRWKEFVAWVRRLPSTERRPCDAPSLVAGHC
jgi:methionyl-tRNA formyltransferase